MPKMSCPLTILPCTTYQFPTFSKPGALAIRVTLAFDPPVRHTRADYTGVGMTFRLVRGCDPELIFDHYRRRSSDEDHFPEIAGRFQCKLSPGPRERELGTVQTATVKFTRETRSYGDDYYLVIRCEGGWANNFVTEQSFAVVVELSHPLEARLYERLRQRVRVPV